MFDITAFDVISFIGDEKITMEGQKFVLGLFVLVIVQRYSFRFVLVRLNNPIKSEDDFTTNVDDDFSKSRSLVHGSRQKKSLKQKGRNN